MVYRFDCFKKGVLWICNINLLRIKLSQELFNNSLYFKFQPHRRRSFLKAFWDTFQQSHTHTFLKIDIVQGCCNVPHHYQKVRNVHKWDLEFHFEVGTCKISSDFIVSLSFIPTPSRMSSSPWMSLYK